MTLATHKLELPAPTARRPNRSSSARATRELASEPGSALHESLIMVVDDDATTIESVVAFLEDAGYRKIVTTSHSSEALEMMLREPPDLVLLDVIMPEVSGFDILAEMRTRAEFEHTPAIIFTSSDEPDTKLKALRLGATDFLTKPVDVSELLLRVRNTLAAKAYLDRLTYVDSLTGLPNRVSLANHLDAAVVWALRENKTSAVLLVDLDRFKEVNDTLGHPAGDELLHAVARKLEKCIRQSDALELPGRQLPRQFLSRIGGDEFTIVLCGIQRAEDANTVAERIRDALSRPMMISGNRVMVTPSIGIALLPDDGADRETLLRNADIAMSHAKQKGRNTFRHYSDSISSKSKAELSLQAELHHVVERQELTLHYQPKVDIRSGLITGCEALVRWQHPTRGLVPPGEFIWLAEEAGLINQIGDWALLTACRQNAAWQSAHLGMHRVAVNVSSHQFRDGQLAPSIQRALDASQLKPEHLIIELTERTMIDKARENVDLLHRIKSMGVKISVDDFGTGYSSLSYLEQFPLDELKIDRAFVDKIDAPETDAPIVSAIIAMSHSLRFTVVAEGVETEAQLEFLRSRGCDAYQGYLFSKPVTAAAFSKLLSAWRPHST